MIFFSTKGKPFQIKQKKKENKHKKKQVLNHMQNELKSKILMNYLCFQLNSFEERETIAKSSPSDQFCDIGMYLIAIC